jgi:hypothetical protein
LFLIVFCSKPALPLSLALAAAPADHGAIPRTARAAVGGSCYHVLNRGNRQGEVFHGPDDYAAFVRLLRQGNLREAGTVSAAARCAGKGP